MPITTTPGGTAYDGPHAVEAFRLNTFIRGLELEGATGMRLTRGPSMLARAKAVTGLRTNDRAKHIAKLREMMADALRRDGGQ